jgi:hypothetical protein
MIYDYLKRIIEYIVNKILRYPGWWLIIKINDIVFITRIVIKILVVLKADMLTLFSTFPCDTGIFISYYNLDFANQTFMVISLAKEDCKFIMIM